MCIARGEQLCTCDSRAPPRIERNTCGGTLRPPSVNRGMNLPARWWVRDDRRLAIRRAGESSCRSSGSFRSGNSAHDQIRTVDFEIRGELLAESRKTPGGEVTAPNLPRWSASGRAACDHYADALRFASKRELGINGLSSETHEGAQHGR